MESSTKNSKAVHYNDYLKKSTEKDNVNHPAHYQKNGLEVIDMIKACTEGLEGIQATDTGNVIKYMARWNDKNGLEDLKKAQWYLNHLIGEVENTSGKCKDTDKNKNAPYFYAFESREKAQSTLCSLWQIAMRKGHVTVDDLLELVTGTSTYNSNRGYAVGWTMTDVFSGEVHKMDDGFMIYLPKIRLL